MENKIIKNRDFILFSSQSWDAGIGSNFKDIARELSKHNRVLFVDRATDRFSSLKNKVKPRRSNQPASTSRSIHELVEVQPRLWTQNPNTVLESINWIPFAAVHDFMNKINNKRLAKQINTAVNYLGFKDAILINDNDFIRGRYLKQMVNCSFYIFYKRDDMLGIRYFHRHGPRLQAGILKEADMIATNSAYLAGIARKFNANSYDTGQGCDFSIFNLAYNSIPADIRHIKKPVVGYTGYISAWRIDISFIKHLAETLPECSIVLIGPVDKLFRLNEIEHIGNIYLIGSKAVEELPGYINYFDVCINPQILNDITIGNYPRKIDEYLALGKPVVATATEAMKMFEPYTSLCSNKVEFVEKIKHILEHPGLYMSEEAIARRRAFASTHTWANSIEKLGAAYFETQRNALKRTEPFSSMQGTKHWLPYLAISFIAAYLLFVYIKFIFF